MNFAYSIELMAETMCSGVIQGGPELSDTQLLDTAVTAFTKAVSTATAAGPAGTDIVNESNVGLARTYLQLGDYTNAATTAALVPSDFVANVVTSGNMSTQGLLGNLIYGTHGQRPGSGAGALQGGRPAHADRQYYASGGDVERASFDHPDEVHELLRSDPARIGTRGAVHCGRSDAARLAAAPRRRSHSSTRVAPRVDKEPTPAPRTTSPFSQELLNQRARDFWMEGKKLGDLRRNPTVPLPSVLTDPVGAPFYTSVGGGTFGDTFCAPIPPEETNANPNF